MVQLDQPAAWFKIFPNAEVGSRNATMPALAFLAVVGMALVALLFVADATLETSSPAIVTSERSGLPKPWHPDTMQTLTTAHAPVPDMTSQTVRAAQPPEAKIDTAAHSARAEAPPRKKRVTQQPNNYQQNYLIDRFSAKGQ
jgi:hypothetical protein